MRRGRLLSCALLTALMLIPLTARAGRGHRALPALNGKRPGLTLKVIRYTGGTNGKMVVEVKNPGRKSVTFQAQGLYFVPEGDPNKAPQRLGAAGPFEVAEGGHWKRHERLRVKPGHAVRIQLQVFCIDSHRSSPSSTDHYRMAVKRLPRPLRRKISTGTRTLLRRSRGRMPAAKAAIQSHIWKTRDAHWIRLEGERAREKNPRPKRHHYRLRPRRQRKHRTR